MNRKDCLSLIILCMVAPLLAPIKADAQCCSAEQHTSTRGLLAETQCVPCLKDTYCKTSGQRKICTQCSDASIHNNELILFNCTPTSDAVIGCAPGYYRRQIQQEFDCSRCSKCRKSYEARRCDATTDTVCCPSAGMGVVSDGRGGFVCNITCRRGEYLNMVLRRCELCPPQTYMPVEGHRYNSCWSCLNHSSHKERAAFESCGCDIPAEGYSKSNSTSHIISLNDITIGIHQQAVDKPGEQAGIEIVPTTVALTIAALIVPVLIIVFIIYRRHRRMNKVLPLNNSNSLELQTIQLLNDNL